MTLFASTTQIDVSQVARFFSRVMKKQTNAVAQFGSVDLETASEDALNRFCMLACNPTDSVVLKNNVLHCNLKSDQKDITISESSHLFETLRMVQSSQSDLLAWQTWALNGSQFEKSEKAITDNKLPCQGGWAGILGYPFYRWCDDAFTTHQSQQTQSSLPDLVMHRFSDWLVWDNHNQTLSLFSCRDNVSDVYQNLWSQSDVSNNSERCDIESPTFRPTLNQDDFCKHVETIQHHILEGDLYQANLSVGFDTTIKNGSSNNDISLALFDQLIQTNPSPFSGVYHFGDTTLVSNSPERLVRIQSPLEEDSMRVDTRPIAGTRRRGKTEQEDKANEVELLASSKEQAEHMMLVDLERNDLGRVCLAGSVEVDELLVVERYSHVMHLVSNVAGELKPECDMWDVIQSTFPGGTITGCPKIRCIQTLNALEPTSRGWYTGSMFYWDERTGAFDSSILIRSIVAQRDSSNNETTLSLQVGAGIVADSVPTHEYKESLSKGKASFDAIEHVLRCDNGAPLQKLN